MVDMLRPDYGQAWASEGEKLAPAQDKVAMGWIQEMMPFQYENFLQARQDEALLYLLQKGVAEYSATQEYTANKSIVQYQGNLYLATATVTGVLPTVTASWRRLSPALAANGSVSVAGGGTGATSAAQARANLGLGDASTATLPTATGVVVKGAGETLISRLLTGTSGDIVITNPDGVAGNINVGVGSNVAKTNQDSSWTSNGGITLPKGSSGDRGVEVPGKIRYNTELQKFEGYDGTSWNALGAASEAEITTLSGDGVTTNFTLNSPAFSGASVDVYIGGIWQNKGTYTISGSSLSFSEAPLYGVDNIQAISRRVVDLGVTTASQVSVEDTTNLYTSTTVEGALREVGDKVKFVKNAILSYPDYAAASAAAATLPDGQSLQVQDGSGIFTVVSGALVEDQEFDFQKNYAASTIGANLKAWVNVKSFPWLAKGDGVTDDTAAIRAAIATGVNVFIPQGVYKITGGIRQQRGQLVHGAGCDQWDFASTTGKPQYMERGTTILASGACDDYVQVFGVTENRLSGGVTQNATGDSSEFTEYVLSDFTNKDAVGTGMATLRQVKCAWVVEEASNASLADLRIQLNYNGVDGYNDANLTGLGDEYDIGLMVLNSSFCRFVNVQSVGYWRMGALAHINGEDKSVGTSKMGEGAFNTFDHCFFQGLRGAILRGSDEFPVVSVVAGASFTVPRTASNLIAVGDSLADGVSFYTVESLTAESDLLRISVSGSTPNVGYLLRHVRYNFGVAGTVFRDCVITGLFHKSRRSPKDLGLAMGSIGLEISGGTLRDFDFINCHVFDGDCVMYANTVDDVGFVGCYFEPYGTRYPNGTWRDSGAKMIVNGFGSASWAPYPAKGVRNISFDRTTEISPNVDMFPWNVSRPARYTDAGHFRPQTCTVDANGSQVLNPIPKQGWDSPTTIITTRGSGVNRLIRFIRPDFSYLGRVNESNGFWGFGPKDPATQMHVSTLASETPSGLHDITNDAPNAALQLRSTASGAKWVRLVNYGSLVQLLHSSGQSSSFSSTAWSYNYNTPDFAVNGTIRHTTDNTQSYGAPSNRGTTIYLGSNPVVTSDGREKQQIRELSEAERRVGYRLKHLIRAFKYNDAVVLKGDGARIHVGWIAQQVKAAFEAEGLDGFEYACLCYDEWDEQPEQLDDEGNVIQPYQEAGNRYGVRESQLLTFIISAL